MPAADDVVWIDVLPSLARFRSELGRGLRGVDTAASGRSAGASWGRGFSSAAQQGVEGAEAALRKVRRQAEDAAGRVRVAEARLQEVRASSRATGSQLARAEETLASARRRERELTQGATTAEGRLLQARRESRIAARDQQSASRQVNDETARGNSLVSRFSTGWIKTAAVVGTVTYAAYGLKTAFQSLYSTIDVASSVVEETNKAMVVFGQYSDSVLKFSEGSAASMGEARVEALQAAGTFGNLFRAVGIGEAASSEMSKRLVTMTADLASFNNASVDDVFIALRAGLVGEAEPMRRYGVDLSDLTLKQEAANLGIYDGTGVLNQHQKAMAAFMAILHQTTLAQGDFVRTSDGLANQTRILRAHWIDLKGALGSLLLGPANRLTHWLNDLLPRMESGIGGLRRFGQAFREGFGDVNGQIGGSGAVAAFQALGQHVGSTVQSFQDLADVLGRAVRAGLATAAPAIDHLNQTLRGLFQASGQLSQIFHDMVVSLGQALAPVIRAVVPLLASAAAIVGDALVPALHNVLTAVDTVGASFGTLLVTIAQAALPVVNALTQVFTGLAQVGADLARVFANEFSRVIREVTPALQTLVTSLGEAAQIVGQALFSALRTLSPTLSTVAETLGEVARIVLGSFANALASLAEIVPPLAEAFGRVASVLAGALSSAVNAIAPVLPRIAEAFAELLTNAIEPLLPLLPRVANIFATILTAVAPLLPAIAEVVGVLANLAASVLPVLNPVLAVLTRSVELLVTAFEALGTPMQVVIVGLGALRIAFGISAATVFADAIARIRTAFVVLGTAATTTATQMRFAFSTAPIGVGGLTSSLGGLASRGFGAVRTAAAGLVGFFGGPWGLAIAGVVTGLTLLANWLDRSDEATQRTTHHTDDFRRALEQSGGSIDQYVRAAAAKEAQDLGMLEIAQELGIPLSQVTDAILGQGNALNEVSAQLLQYRDARVYGSDADKIAAERANTMQRQLRELAGQTPQNIQAAQQLAEATGATGDAAAATVGQFSSADAAVDRWRSNLASVNDSFIDPLATYRELLNQKAQAEFESAQATEGATTSASQSWQDFVDGAQVDMDEYAASLTTQIEAQENWRNNLGIIAQRGGEELAQILTDMGADGIQIVQDMVDANAEDFANWRDLLIRESRLAGDGANTALDARMRVMAEIGRRGANATAEEISRELGIGVADVQRIASQYGINLASGINPILGALGKQLVNVPLLGAAFARASRQAHGSVLDFYAAGGMRENHVAQIAPAGAWRVWAEDETGGEAYIPLHPSKRARSLDIWQETGRRLGVPVQQFADGGVWRSLWNIVHGAFPTARLTSSYRPGDPGYHGSGNAVDVAGPTQMDMPAMLAINRWLAARFPNSTELIHTPGINLWHGMPHVYNAATRAQHYNHVHWAMATLAALGSGSAIPAVTLPKPPNYPWLGIGYSANRWSEAAHDMAQNWLNAVLPSVGAPGVAGAAASGPVQSIVQAVANKYGWGSGAQWNALVQLVQKESSWSPTAQNPTSTAYGLFQFLNSTWGSVGGYKTSDPRLQAEFGLRYILQRYGSPSSALGFHLAHNWYDTGGMLGPGMSGSNGTGFDERVLSPRQTVAFERLVDNLDRNGGHHPGGGFTVDGNLYLDSGEFMGKVRGVLSSRDDFDARELRSA